VLLEGLTHTLVSTAGDRDRWRIERDVMTDLAPASLQRRFDETLEQDGRWTRDGGAGATESRWLGTAADGERWRRTIGVAAAGEGIVRATFEVERIGEAMSKH